MLHIHSVVEECEIIELIEEIDTKKKKDGDPKKKKRKPLFVKNGAVVKCRIQVSLGALPLDAHTNILLTTNHISKCLQVNNLICIEKFSDFAQLGRFTLRTEGIMINFHY